MTTTWELIGRFAGSLDGEVVVVTGAGSGIGRACAESFARCGADVALIGRRADALGQTAGLVAAAGRRALVTPADVGDADHLADAIARVNAELGVVSVAVANAGVNAWGELVELTPNALRRALVTNVEGVANLARAVVPAMRSHGAGKLLVVASDNGRRAEPGGSGYVASTNTSAAREAVRARSNQVSRTSSSCHNSDEKHLGHFSGVVRETMGSEPHAQYHAGIRCPHQSWREMHQSLMFSIQFS